MFALQRNFICSLKCERAHHAWWDSEGKLKGNRTMCEGAACEGTCKRFVEAERRADTFHRYPCFNKVLQPQMRDKNRISLVFRQPARLWPRARLRQLLLRSPPNIFLVCLSSHRTLARCIALKISSSWSEWNRWVALDADEDSMAEDGWCWIRRRLCVLKKV